MRTSPRHDRRPVQLCIALAAATALGCGADAAGDDPCPSGTWRSGSGCIDNGLGDDSGADADVGVDDVGTEIDTGGREDAGVDDTGGSDASADAAADVDPMDTSEDTPEPDAGPTTPTTLPFAVDDYYAPSGFMGDGETPGGITVVDDACDGDRAGDASGVCRSFTWTRGANGWGGVFWQYPDGNWGDAPGLPVPSGAVEVTFYAWGETGDEVVNFLVGIGDVDGFATESGPLALGTEPAQYTLSLDGLAVGDEVVGGFGWVTDTGDAATFTVDDIQWR